MEELVSLLRVYRRKKDLRDPKMPLQEGKRNEKSALAGLGGRKSCPDPKKQKKRVWKVDFHESDPNRRKTSLHNAKKYAMCGSEREKKPCQTRTLLCRQGRLQKYLKNRFVGIEKSRQKVTGRINKF